MRRFKRSGARATTQKGVAALEFSLVAALLLMILFGVVSYGGAFLVQQSLSRAAHEGARAMLQASLAPGQPAAPADVARAVCEDSLKSLNQSFAVGSIVCVPSVPTVCNYDATLQCASVVVTYPDYRSHPMAPAILPLGTWLAALWSKKDGWLPKDLSATATVQLGLMDAS